MKIRLGILTLISFTLLGFNFYKKNYEINNVEMVSPNNELVAIFDVLENEMSYSVMKGDEVIISSSSLGFEFKNQEELKSYINIVAVEEDLVEESWTPLFSNTKKENNYSEYKILCEEEFGEKRNFYLIFRIYDDGVAFRYDFPEQNNLSTVEITKELTSFNFPSDYDTWWINDSMNAYKNSMLSEVRHVGTPFVLVSDNDTHISVHEAQLVDYSGMSLTKVGGKPFELEAELSPWSDGVMVKTEFPFKTPWRVISITSNALELFSSNLILNLNDSPQLQDVSWIQPLRYSTYSVNYGTEEGIEDIIKNKINSLTLEGVNGVLLRNWNTDLTVDGEVSAKFVESNINLMNISEYAKANEMSILLENETSGDIKNYQSQLVNAFNKYQSVGVAGINTINTFESNLLHPVEYEENSQFMVNHYQKVLESSISNRLLFKDEGSLKQTGLSRTYPNYTEQINRYLLNIGLVEYDVNLSDGAKSYASSAINQSTSSEIKMSKQLAMSVASSTFFEHLSLEDPLYDIKKTFPVYFDETKYIDADLGQYVVQLNQSEDNYFVTAITNDQKRDLIIKLDFLEANKDYQATVYQDGDSNHSDGLNIQTVKVKKDMDFLLNLPENGGIVLEIKPLIDEDFVWYEIPELTIENVTFKESVLSNNKIPLTITYDYKGTLFADDDFVIKIGDKTQKVNVRKNQNGEAKFNFDSIFETGDYDVYLNDEVIGSITIKPRLSYVTESDYDVKFFSGGILQASLTLTNLGSEDASRRVRLKVNNVVVQEEVFTVPAKDGGNHITVDLRYLVKIKRTYKVEIGSSPDIFVKYR